ncbi:MAG: SDR family NAD(P)-dependent oxidoreductase [Acidimicrobiales bacterium]|nr:SDR family NAD(P)-dependent oxidoreductase [Acidimicrobiales bacterium]
MADQIDVVARDRVAVVTGAASGIGLGLTERFVAEGMRVVMADVEAPALEEAAKRLSAQGAEVEPVVVDVSKAEEVERLRDRAVDAFGAVHLLCNNAGVGGATGPLWLISPREWEWVLGVNLGGVINGVRSFMPLLLEQDAAHVVNTASIFGVFAGALGPYSVSKHAIVAYTESLYFQLRDAGARVGVSVLCPGAVQTRFGDSARNRPPDVGPPPEPGPNDRTQSERLGQLTPAGRDPSEVADIVVDGIRRARFYILTSTNRNEAVRRRGEEVVAGAPPRDPFP